MSKLQKIYLITVFSKCEPDERCGYNIGSTRTVGWRPTFEMAEDTVKNNVCDIWEYCYDYACIEELDYRLYPWPEERWFYKFNEKTKQYEEIDEPVFLKNRGPIGGIGLFKLYILHLGDGLRRGRCGSTVIPISLIPIW